MAAPPIKPLNYAALRNGYDSEMHRLDSPGLDFEDGLLEAHAFVQRLRRTTELPFSRRLHASGHEHWQEASGVLAKERTPLRDLSEPFLARFHLSPQINALVQISAMFGLPRHSWQPNEPSRFGRGKPCGELFNIVVQTVRERAALPGFNQPVVARRAIALSDCVSATALVKSVTKSTRHVFGNRLDLMYRESVRASITPADVKADVHRFLNNWRKLWLHKTLKGYLWKLQYGIRSGYYVHLITLLDGGRMDLSVDPVREFGSVWHRVTAEHGEVWTPSQRVPIFSAGQGIWRDKRKSQAALLAGIYYLLQKDAYFRVRAGLRSRIFGRSELG
jgi:hypothetical protein